MEQNHGVIHQHMVIELGQNLGFEAGWSVRICGFAASTSRLYLFTVWYNRWCATRYVMWSFSVCQLNGIRLYRLGSKRWWYNVFHGTTVTMRFPRQCNAMLLKSFRLSSLFWITKTSPDNWLVYASNRSPPGMFLPLAILWQYCIEHVIIGLLYVKFIRYSTREFQASILVWLIVMSLSM